MSDPLEHLGKLLLVAGIIVAAIGGLMLLLRNSGVPFGKLPGDIFIQRKNFTFYFPVVTSIILSIILSIIFYFLSRK